MKKKGFTLIELLAVIIILAIIALIIIPVVSNLIHDARKQSFKLSVYGLIDSTDNYITEYSLLNAHELSFPASFNCDGTSCKRTSGDTLKFKGKVPVGGTVTINEGGVLIDYITDGTFCAYGYKWNLEITTDCNSIIADPYGEPGVYDQDDNLIADWDTLVTEYDLNISKDYTSTTYRIDNLDGDSLYYVLYHYPEFKDVVKVIIDDSVVTIGDMAASRCRNLKTVIMPDSIKSIKAVAFANNNRSIEELVIGNNVESIGKSAFEQSLNLKKLVIPDSVKTIGKSAFLSNIIEEIDFGKVESIGEHAFYWNYYIKEVVIPESVVHIGAGAFASTNESGQLSSIVFADTDSSWAHRSVDYTEEFTIDDVSDSSENAIIMGASDYFDEWMKIDDNHPLNIYSSIALEPGLYDTYNNQIADWDTLVNTYNFNISKDYTSFNTTYSGVDQETDGDSLRYVMSKYSMYDAKKLIIPSGITTIGDYSLYFSSLYIVRMPDTIEKLGKWAFAYNNLSKIDLSQNLVSIGEHAFSYNSNITNIVLPESLTSIDKYTFWYINNLESIVFADSTKQWKVNGYPLGNGIVSVDNPQNNVTMLTSGLYSTYPWNRMD